MSLRESGVAPHPRERADGAGRRRRAGDRAGGGRRVGIHENDEDTAMGRIAQGFRRRLCERPYLPGV